MMIDTGYQVRDNPDTLVTHRILSDIENRLWLFFQTSYGSLAYGTSLDGGNTWSPARELMPDISGPFSAAAGNGGALYIVARRVHPPDINIITWNGTSWLSGIIMPTAGKKVVTGYPLIFEGGDNLVHILFASRSYSSGQWEIKHNVLDLGRQEVNNRQVPQVPGPEPRLPKRMDFLKEILFWSGDIAIDQQNTIHMACRFFTGSHYQIFHSSYRENTGQWQQFTPLTGTPYHRGHPKIAVGTEESQVHVIYQVEEEKGNVLVSQTLSANGRWEGERVLARSVETDFMPEVIRIGSGPLVYWADNSGVNRSCIGETGPPKKILDKKISFLSATCQGDKAYLAFTRKNNHKNVIFLLTDNLVK